MRQIVRNLYIMTKKYPTKEKISTDLEQIGIVRVRRIGGDQETGQSLGGTPRPHTRSQPAYNMHSPSKPTFWSVSLYGQPFSRYKVMDGNAPNDLNEFEHFSHSKYPIYTKYFSQRPNFGRFRSTTCRFREIRLSIIGKVGNAPNDLRVTLNSVKTTLCKPNTYPQGPNFGKYRSTINRFQDTACFISPH